MRLTEAQRKWMARQPKGLRFDGDYLAGVSLRERRALAICRRGRAKTYRRVRCQP